MLDARRVPGVHGFSFLGSDRLSSRAVQVGQLAWLDAAPFEHGVQVLSMNPNRELTGRKPAFTDHPVDRGHGQVEVLASRLGIEPLRHAIH